MMDSECIHICKAINSIPGLSTYESCCGHGESALKIYFSVTNLANLPILLYYIDPCHVGFRWHCRVKTDCAMSSPTFVLESVEVGEAAYVQAARIADVIDTFIRENPGGLNEIS